KTQGHLNKFCKLVTNTNAYMESGTDIVPTRHMRPLAYWEPPCTMVALWPTGTRGEVGDRRVVDTGNLMVYCSYPESRHLGGVSVEEAGPDYVRVPQEEHSIFALGGAPVPLH